MSRARGPLRPRRLRHPRQRRRRLARAGKACTLKKRSHIHMLTQPSWLGLRSARLRRQLVFLLVVAMLVFGGSYWFSRTVGRGVIPEEDGATRQQRLLARCEMIYTDLRAALHEQGGAVCGVNVSGQNLFGFPPDIAALSSLQVVQANDNPIRLLPPHVGRFSQLRLLELRNSGLSDLPEELFALQQLELLDLRGNRLPEHRVAAARQALPNTLILY